MDSRAIDGVSVSGSEHQPLVSESILVQLAHDSRRWIRELQIHAEISSTNSHLMARAASQSIDGIVCLAERQTGGRGRRGRTWLTPSGQNIALSLGKSVPISVAQVAPLSLVVGLAAVSALKRVGVDNAMLKWPNDLLLNGAKVGGILIELPSIGNPLTVVVGIGINMGSGEEVSAHLGSPVGDLLAGRISISRNTLAAELINSVFEMTSRFELHGFATMRPDWEDLHAHQDRNVRVIGTNETIEGIARGVTDSGELILETAAGIRHFSGGEVSLRSEHGSS
jgi:BirA family transcriptional regulator, biotin operon repressor / biotin---[acetyl-CoA-carboxylase] ligase